MTIKIIPFSYAKNPTWIVLVLTLVLPSGKSVLEKCLHLKNVKGGKQVNLHLYVKSRILRQFYTDNGICKSILHADSVRLNRVCSNFDVHFHNQSEFKLCEQNGRPGSRLFRKCVWNKKNVRSFAVLRTKWTVPGGAVLIEFYDQPNCRTLLVRDLVQVRRNWISHFYQKQNYVFNTYSPMLWSSIDNNLRTLSTSWF